MPSPVLGSLAIQAPTPTHTVHVSPQTCHNISLFKGPVCLRSKTRYLASYKSADLMKEYRKLDDSITMRLNRTAAQFRDLERTGSSGKGSVQDQACLHLWRELVGTSSKSSHLLIVNSTIIVRQLDSQNKNIGLLRWHLRHLDARKRKGFGKFERRSPSSAQAPGSSIRGRDEGKRLTICLSRYSGTLTSLCELA